MTPLISVHTLSKSFGTHTLFKNISFTIGQGDRIGLLGQNGSGKTTLINLIPRFYDVDSGRVLIDGMDVREMSQNAQKGNGEGW